MKQRSSPCSTGNHDVFGLLLFRDLAYKVSLRMDFAIVTLGLPCFVSLELLQSSSNSVWSFNWLLNGQPNNDLFIKSAVNNDAIDDVSNYHNLVARKSKLQLLSSKPIEEKSIYLFVFSLFSNKI